MLANSALEQFKNLQSSLEACRVEECREQLRRDIDELHQRHVLEQEALEADWDAKFDAFAQKCSEITRQIEEQWIETEKSLDFNVQAELRPYVPSPALFNMRRGLRTLVKMREYILKRTTILLWSRRKRWQSARNGRWSYSARSL